MERCTRAIHLRTGDRGADGAIASWLQRHRADVVNCPDPFAACTFASMHPEPARDVAFIGADRLAPDETAIIDYLRDTWPEVVTVVYGSPAATAGIPAVPLMLVCRSAEEVRQLLEDSPDALLRRPFEPVRAPTTRDDGWRRQPQGCPPDDQLLDPQVAPQPRPTIRTRDADLLAAELTPRVGGQDSQDPAGKDPPRSEGILTREELAALLDDDDQKE